MSLIKDAWNKTTPICAECGDIMNFEELRGKFIYRCPKCKRYFDTYYFEKILDKIAQLDEARFEANELYSIQGEKFNISNKIKCEIAEENELFNEWKIKVKVISE